MAPPAAGGSTRLGRGGLCLAREHWLGVCGCDVVRVLVEGPLEGRDGKER